MNGQKQFDYAAQCILNTPGKIKTCEELSDMAAGLIAAAYRLNELIADNHWCGDFTTILKEEIHTTCKREHLSSGYDISENMRCSLKMREVKPDKRDRRERAIVRKAEEFLDALKRYFDCRP